MMATSAQHIQQFGGTGTIAPSGYYWYKLDERDNPVITVERGNIQEFSVSNIIYGRIPTSNTQLNYGIYRFKSYPSNINVKRNNSVVELVAPVGFCNRTSNEPGWSDVLGVVKTRKKTEPIIWAFGYDLHEALEIGSKKEYTQPISKATLGDRPIIDLIPGVNEININIKKYQGLFEDYTRELKRYPEMHTTETDALIMETASFISELPYEKGSIELARGNAVKYTLLFPGNKMLTITKNVDKFTDVEDKDAIVYAFFINREPIIADVANFYMFIEKFKEYLAV